MQTEQLTDHHAMRLTVEIEPERLQKAKIRAAEKLSKKVNIPGFRKGKAPYRVVVGYFGEGAILEDAIEILGNDVYKQALKESNIEPYGPGQIEDVKLEEEKPVLTFVIPLQPRVTLNNYRDVRQDYTAADVTDTDVDRAMLALQEQHAVVEDTDKTAAKGTRVTVDLDARLVEEDAEAEAEAEEAAVEDQHADEEGHDHEHNHHVDKNTIIHQHDAVLSLAGEDPVIPGFIDAVTGAAVGETRQFELTYPDDAEEFDELAGPKALFTEKDRSHDPARTDRRLRRPRDGHRRSAAVAAGTAHACARKPDQAGRRPDQ
jgi:trigger factor